jgi:hypothetical protein
MVNVDRSRSKLTEASDPEVDSSAKEGLLLTDPGSMYLILVSGVRDHRGKGLREL